jgi:hypothetical protein
MAVRLSSLRGGRPLSPGRFLVLISVRGRVDPRAIIRLERLGLLKNRMTSLEFEPATFRLVVWCLNQLRYRVPPLPHFPSVFQTILFSYHARVLRVLPISYSVIWFINPHVHMLHTRIRCKETCVCKGLRQLFVRTLHSVQRNINVSNQCVFIIGTYWKSKQRSYPVLPLTQNCWGGGNASNIREAARSQWPRDLKARNVSPAGTRENVCSNPTQVMDVCVYSVFM